MNLSTEDFLKIIDNTPLISIDLIVRDSEDRILMGQRINQPALGSWFVPGGRIRKGEDVNTALARIGKEEIGVRLNRFDGRCAGVFDHFYDTNFANIEGITTQYVVLAFKCRLQIDLGKLPMDQHSQWRWIAESESGSVHENAAAYLILLVVFDPVLFARIAL